jgi:hypothetical protein
MNGAKAVDGSLAGSHSVEDILEVREGLTATPRDRSLRIDCDSSLVWPTRDTVSTQNPFKSLIAGARCSLAHGATHVRPQRTMCCFLDRAPGHALWVGFKSHRNDGMCRLPRCSWSQAL